VGKRENDEINLCGRAACDGARSWRRYAQEFKNEATPLFDSCGDPPMKCKGQRHHGRHLPSPPSSINPDSQKAEGLEVEIDEAALHWAGIENIKYEVMPFAVDSALQATHRHGGGHPRHA
jgi:hypothetical protein